VAIHAFFWASRNPTRTQAGLRVGLIRSHRSKLSCGCHKRLFGSLPPRLESRPRLAWHGHLGNSAKGLNEAGANGYERIRAYSGFATLIRVTIDSIVSLGRPEALLSRFSRLLPCGRQSAEAPLESRSLMNGLCARCAARESAVCPNLLVAFTSAPLEMSSSPSIEFPSRAASISSVQPRRFERLGSAPRSSERLKPTISPLFMSLWRTSNLSLPDCFCSGNFIIRSNDYG
jgi:hypothetical protein